ncbi:MAG: GlsB/YeaQ/YmgE family stress response membrane protein [Anaerolineae bacterium]|nr:GlsB/YeaQ/YmgE family stress response membrane protein [Anaerolineae bacterium]
MHLLAWLIIGLIAGWLASKVIPRRMGIAGDTVIGILGALAGGLLFNILGVSGVTGLNIWSVFVAFVGAIALLLVIRAVNGRPGLPPGKLRNPEIHAFRGNRTKEGIDGQ